jgi:crotonobetainyl-CoA:carnitine CoA-transferase CaiB-like acyl-CoA transferase
MSSILNDIRVLEIAEGIAGPTCGLQLADLGAEVIKVEPPEGDRAREWGPPMAGEDAAIFAHLNRGKKSLQLDLQDSSGRAALLSLLGLTDVVIVHMEPEDRAALGFDWDDLVQRHPRLIVCLLTDLGESGPWADQPSSELVCQALSGMTRYMSQPAGPPLRLGFEIAAQAVAMHAIQAVLAALLWRRRSGAGQVVTLSQLGSLLSMKTIQLAAQSSAFDAWKGFHLNGPQWPPDIGWQTCDGQISFDFRNNRKEGWEAFCREIGLGHLVDDAEYSANFSLTADMGDRRDDLGQVYRAPLSALTSAAASEMINRHNGTSMKFNDLGEALAHPQTQTRDPLIAVPSAPPGATIQLGTPFKIIDTPPRTDYHRAPRLGEHSQAVLQQARDFAGTKT